METIFTIEEIPVDLLESTHQRRAMHWLSEISSTCQRGKPWKHGLRSGCCLNADSSTVWLASEIELSQGALKTALLPES